MSKRAHDGSIAGGTALGNKLYGNLIGTTPAGTSVIPNVVGILTTARPA